MSNSKHKANPSPKPKARPLAGRAYQRQSEANELAAHRARMEKNLRRRAKQLGYELHKIDPPTAEVPVA